MTQAAKAQEPSMEEILASIRRIIADDDASKSALRAQEPPKAEPAPVPPAPPAPPPVYAAPPPPPAPPPAALEIPPALEPAAAMAMEPIEDQSSDILDLTEFDDDGYAGTRRRKCRPSRHASARAAIPYHRRQLRYCL